MLGNGGLPAGDGLCHGFMPWRAFARYSPLFPIGRIVQGGTRRRLRRRARGVRRTVPYACVQGGGASLSVARAARTPDNPASDANRKAWQVFEHWDKPFICCFSDGDPITRGIDRTFRERVPGTRGQPHTTLSGGHFIQEDDARAFAGLVVAACTNDSPARSTS